VEAGSLDRGAACFWIVFVAALAAIGWYVSSEFVDPPPYRDSEAVGAATAPGAGQLATL
jgi:hypothetical protein